MNSKKNLILIGMMGSGKSTIGSLIAKKLNLELVDSDREIEKKEKMAISEIFKVKGELYFREIEEKIVMKLIDLEPKIISLGGGSFLNKKIQKKILSDCISFWLNWRNATIISRIKFSKKRPLAINLNHDQLTKLILSRSKIYMKANHKINCENLKRNEIVNKIIKIYEN